MISRLGLVGLEELSAGPLVVHQLGGFGGVALTADDRTVYTRSLRGS